MAIVCFSHPEKIVLPLSHKKCHPYSHRLSTCTGGDRARKCRYWNNDQFIVYYSHCLQLWWWTVNYCTHAMGERCFTVGYTICIFGYNSPILLLISLVCGRLVLSWIFVCSFFICIISVWLQKHTQLVTNNRRCTCKKGANILFWWFCSFSHSCIYLYKALSHLLSITFLFYLALFLQENVNFEDLLFSKNLCFLALCISYLLFCYNVKFT